MTCYQEAVPKGLSFVFHTNIYIKHTILIHMDLNNQFKDLDLNKLEDTGTSKASKNKVDQNFDIPANQEIEKISDFDESDKILAELEAKLAKIKEEDLGEESEEDRLSVDAPFVERIQPFIIPICLTIFAIFFAGLFLYFFSNSRPQETQRAIQNQGNIEVVEIPPKKPAVVEIKEPEPLVCGENQTLSEDGLECIDLPPPPPTKLGFDNGTTTVLNVKFSYDKFNYDNYPRGIYLLSEQIFDGSYEDFKLLPNSRPYANDKFFGIDRYMVSLIGSCQFVIDDAQILVSNVHDSQGGRTYSAIGDRYFTGNVVKIINASKPRIDCKGVPLNERPAATGQDEATDEEPVQDNSSQSVVGD